MSNHRRFAWVLAIAVTTPCGGHAADPALYEAAKKEGQLVWYTSLIVNQAVRPLVEAFNKKHPGIEVKYARADSGPNAIKIMNEAQAGRPQSDVFDGIDTTPPLLTAGLVERYVPSEANKYPAELKDPAGRWNALVASVRVMGPCIAMGAAAAHGLDLAGSGSVRQSDIGALRRRLADNLG